MPKRKQREMFDKYCDEIIDNNINMTVPWYIMAAYTYYVDDKPLLEDNTFDRLAKKLLANWEQVEHMHKSFLTKDMLEAGTYLGDYPKRVKDAVIALRGKNG